MDENDLIMPQIPLDITNLSDEQIQAIINEKQAKLDQRLHQMKNMKQMVQEQERELYLLHRQNESIEEEHKFSKQ